MNPRPEPLRSVLDAACDAFRERAGDARSGRSVREVFARLATPAPGAYGTKGRRLPVCEHLGAAIDRPMPLPALQRLADAFRALEPSLVWRPRAGGETASANFSEGHANAMIVGPGGFEERRDAWLGVTLMAPNVRYPDHDHAPEEVYLVLSEGDFRHGDSGWFSPGIGGSFYNEPGIGHAMRSRDTPLLAFWALRPD